MATCSPMVGHFFDTMIVASSDKECSYNESSKYKCWNLFRATLMKTRVVSVSIQKSEVRPMYIGIY